MENINLKIEKPGQEIILREGHAPGLIEKESINISGTITAPASYYNSKVKAGHLYELQHCLLTIDRECRAITLNLNDETDEYSEIITGKLEEYKDLKTFKINTPYRWSTKALKDFIKMNRVYFPDKDSHRTLVTNLTNFKAKVDTHIEDSDDSKGNKILKFAQALETEISLDFTLSIPLFKGTAHRSFKVEVNFDIRERSLELWLESVELKELSETIAIELIDNQIEILKDIPFVEV
tara:strand:- start:8443 stop:9153 length:711 start_codon:yes stop_codon:yes gene_type:complete